LLLVLRQLGIPGAALAGLLFAVHPVTVESVAWITERKALLSTLLFLLALAGWLRFRSSGQARWYAFTGLAFLLALMAKTATVMFPVILVLVEWYRRQAWTPRARLHLAPFFAMAAIAGVTSIVFEHFFIGSAGADWSASFGERLAAAGRIPWFYLGKLLLPLDLSFNYPRWQIDAASPWSYLPGTALVAVAAILWRYRSGSARPWALGLGCFLANLFPVLGFFDIYGMRYAHVADHWQYLACTSVLALAAGVLAAGLDGVTRARPQSARVARRAAGGIAALALAVLGWSTWQQSAAYVDRITLWRHTLERQPGSLIANNNVGTYLLQERRPAEAIPFFRRVIEADPTALEAQLNLGLALDAIGDHAQAEAAWRKILEQDPEQTHALHHLAVAQLKRRRFDDAEALLRRSLLADPKNGPALAALGWLYREQGRPEALGEFALRAQQPPRADRVAGGRRIALPIWAAMGCALTACGGVAALEARRPERVPQHRDRRRRA
jgi:tetratricopeptide (TPR) repeat protein